MSIDEVKGYKSGLSGSSGYGARNATGQEIRTNCVIIIMVSVH